MPTMPTSSHSQRTNSNTVDLQSRRGTVNLTRAESSERQSEAPGVPPKAFEPWRNHRALESL